MSLHNTYPNLPAFALICYVSMAICDQAQKAHWHVTHSQRPGEPGRRSKRISIELSRHALVHQRHVSPASVAVLRRNL